MSSTPKHIVMYNAFGWEPPAFAHVGLLQNDDRQKLSKRNMDLDIGSLRENGIFPEALVNFVALLGWSHSRGNDFMTLKDLEGNVRRVLISYSWKMLICYSSILNLLKVTLSSIQQSSTFFKKSTPK